MPIRLRALPAAANTALSGTLYANAYAVTDVVYNASPQLVTVGGLGTLPPFSTLPVPAGSQAHDYQDQLWSLVKRRVLHVNRFRSPPVSSGEPAVQIEFVPLIERPRLTVSGRSAYWAAAAAIAIDKLAGQNGYDVVLDHDRNGWITSGDVTLAERLPALAVSRTIDDVVDCTITGRSLTPSVAELQWATAVCPIRGEALFQIKRNAGGIAKFQFGTRTHRSVIVTVDLSSEVFGVLLTEDGEPILTEAHQPIQVP